MSGPIRVGIIGANPTRGWALTAHLPGLAVLPGFEIAAVSTTRIESARETAERFGAAHAFADATELATCPDVDVVSVCVKVPNHYELVRTAIDAGKHVLCEWPLGADTAEATDLLARAEAAGVQHIIGLQGRKSPMLNYVRHLVENGYVGSLRSATVSMVTSGRGGPTIAPDRVWTADRRAGVTLLTIIGGHTLDSLRFCLGEFAEVTATVATLDPVSTVIGTNEKIEITAPDHVLVQASLSSRALLDASFVSAARSLGVRIGIYGDAGSLLIEGPSNLHISDSELRLLGASGDGVPSELVVPDAYKTVPDTVPVGAPGNVAGLYLALAAALERGAAVEPDFATALSMHNVIDAIQAASDSGTRTKV